MAQVPAYNQDHPEALLIAGSLEGKAIDLDINSIRPLGTRVGLFVGRRNTSTGEDEGQLLAIKVVPEDGSREPRNGRREANLLAKLSHPNIISLLNAYLDSPTQSSLNSRITLFFPFYPYTLRDLLESQAFVPNDESTDFSTLSYSVAHQLISAISYLHSRSISHRDINPSNVLVSKEGRIVLIDSGIAVEQGDEEPGAQHFEVGTGPYRAPELVFASKSYDIFAIDLWALAATVSELYRPFVSPAPESPDSDDEIDSRFSWMQAPISPAVPTRQSLFTSGSSDFVLAASIFKIVGTPTLETWPEAEHLPNFSRFSFASFPPTSLESHLPFLDSTSPLLQILQSMLTCSASKRMSSSKAERLLESSNSKQTQFSQEATSRYLEELMPAPTF